MSNTILTWVWEAAPVEDASALLVLASLADQANDEGYCWPAVGSIARRCRLSERQVQRWIADLVNAGVLERRERPGTSTMFRIMSQKPTFQGGDAHVTPVTHDTPRGDAHDTPGVSPMTPKPSFNPNKNQIRSAAGAALKANDLRNAFGYWWEKYPKKVGKADAERKYLKACEKVSPSKLLDALVTQVAMWESSGTERKFIPNPATWLHQGRWDDEVAPKAGAESDWMNSPAVARMIRGAANA